MDKITKLFIESLAETPYPVDKIKMIYLKFKKYDHIPITLDIIHSIYLDIVEVFYRNLNEFLIKSGKRHAIKVTNTGLSCGEVESFLETKAYDESDVEFANYDYGFDIPLDCINDFKGSALFYSGGYITSSRVIFIILCILHEIIHIIEYTDPYLSSATNDHTIFFYLLGYKVFGLISRLSEVIDDPSKLKDESELRVNDIQQLKRRRNILGNGADILNDHTHYLNSAGKYSLIGYIAYKINDLYVPMLGGATRRKRNRHRKSRKN